MARVQRWRVKVSEVDYLVELDNFTAASKQRVTVNGEAFVLSASLAALFRGRHESLKLGDEFYPLTIKPFGRAEIYSRQGNVEKIK